MFSLCLSRCPLSGWLCDIQVPCVTRQLFSSLTPFLLASLCQEHSVHWTFACPAWKTSAQSTSIRRCGGCAHRGLLASRPGTSTTSATRQLSSTPNAMGNWVRCSGPTQTWTLTVSETRTAETNQTHEKALKRPTRVIGAAARKTTTLLPKETKDEDFILTCDIMTWALCSQWMTEWSHEPDAAMQRKESVCCIAEGVSERASCPANLQFSPF